MRESVESSTQTSVREQFNILTGNILILSSIEEELNANLISTVVKKEVSVQIKALTELRERFYQSIILGNNIKPLDMDISRIEVLNLR